MQKRINMKIYNVSMDSKFRNHFEGIKQVFLSVTNNCNLRCAHCLYKPWLSTTNGDMPYQIACSLAHAFKEIGAIKISLLGGEPTLYGRDSSKNDLLSLVQYLKKIGYQYIRIVTNGQFEDAKVMRSTLSLFDEVTFSFDGIRAESHDKIRGKGTFVNSLENLNKLCTSHPNIHITFTINSFNIHDRSDSVESVHAAIEWAQDLGVKCVNFHPIFKMEIERDNWIKNTNISISQWLTIYQEITCRIKAKKYSIDVRLPQRFIKKELFLKNADYYSYCPVKIGERIEIHPNGLLQICALLKGTNDHIARYTLNGSQLDITWNPDITNEICTHNFNFSNNHPCGIINTDYLDYVPLCISFKPNQNEIIWNHTRIGY